jgi:hypothetical protein
MTACKKKIKRKGGVLRERRKEGICKKGGENST